MLNGCALSALRKHCQHQHSQAPFPDDGLPRNDLQQWGSLSHINICWTCKTCCWQLPACLCHLLVDPKLSSAARMDVLPTESALSSLDELRTRGEDTGDCSWLCAEGSPPSLASSSVSSTVCSAAREVSLEQHCVRVNKGLKEAC